MSNPFPNLPQIPHPLNTPSKPVIQGVATGGQAKRRYQDTFRDIHKHATARGGVFAMGRPWTAPRELAAMPEQRQPDPFVGGDLQQGEYVVDEYGTNDRAATFASTWFAPWVPNKKYFRFVYDRKLIRFDYQAMFVHEREYLDNYYRAAAKVGIGMNLRVIPGQMPDWQITQELGEPSRMVYIAQAAMANDPWLLGFIDEPNPKLAEILGLSNEGLPLAEYVSPFQPAITVEKVLATPQADLMAELEKVKAEMAEMKAKKAKASADGKAGAAKRYAKKASAPAEVPA